MVVAFVAIWILRPQQPRPTDAMDKTSPYAIESHFETTSPQCRLAVTAWSDKNVSSVPIGQCPKYANRTSSDATLVKVYPQEIAAGNEKVTLMVARWSDSTFSCAVYRQPENVRVFKPQACTW